MDPASVWKYACIGGTLQKAPWHVSKDRAAEKGATVSLECSGQRLVKFSNPLNPRIRWVTLPSIYGALGGLSAPLWCVPRVWKDRIDFCKKGFRFGG